MFCYNNAINGVFIAEFFLKERSYMEKTILHCDGNAFFASVEAALNPKLKEQAFAVCGDPEYRHGIVLAKSEKAKRFGVKTGEAIWQAKQKCPSLLIVKPTPGVYEEYSERIFNIYCRYTDLVEPFGIDECWLDVTGTTHLFGSGKKIADELRETIKHEVGVTISAGVSFNKTFAKIGSDYKKPDATTLITTENFKEILFPLPVSDMLFVGGATLRKLNSVSVFTIGDLANADPEFLRLMLGKCGEGLYACANGFDYSAVAPSTYKREPKSIGNGITFKHDLKTESELRTGIYTICDKVAARMRRHAVECQTIQVAIKDTHMNVLQRQKVLPRPTQLTFELAEAALMLVKTHWDIGKDPVRAFTVTGQDLKAQNSVNEQISFFCLKEYLIHEKLTNLELAKDEIREKYGNKALTMCSVIHNKIGL